MKKICVALKILSIFENFMNSLKWVEKGVGHITLRNIFKYFGYLFLH